ncbi:MFS general substrate transporter [Setomelanomma holmii]|uniref:MFS general substrate transporter n=1 Tax=Setomelanomma holmii TaxID=210430 RepID=A0A9P4LKB5_9PLEO|nr:MFS general substrate transporter [Setomelanomma holmii]
MHSKIANEEEEKLLVHEEALHDERIGNDEATWRNLPQKKQLLIIALCRLSTPLSNSCLLPYLYYLVKSIIADPEHHSAPQQISRLTGLLVAGFPIGQVMTSMLWGCLSDKYGCKPAIILGLTISIVANIGFGFSRTMGTLMLWRILAGMANGIVGVLRTMTAEVVQDRKHRPRAFLAPPFIFNTGRVITLAVGGCLADPIKNLPRLFGPAGAFNLSANPKGVIWAMNYPYALPALFNAMVLSTCLVVATIWLRESHPSNARHHNSGLAFGKSIVDVVKAQISQRSSSKYHKIHSDDSEALVANTNTKASSPELLVADTKSRPHFHDIWTRSLCKTLFAFALLPLHNATFLHVFPILLSMPVALEQTPTLISFTGGLGLSPPTTGFYLALFGISGIVLQLVIYPSIHQRVGTLGVFRLANSIFPIAYIFAPCLALLASHGLVKWVAMAAVLFTQVMARTMAIPSSILLLTEAAPQRNMLGTVHGAGNTLSALASACGPAIGGVLLARGIEIGAIGLVWWSWMASVSIIALAWGWMLSDEPAADEKCLQP